MDHGDYLPRSVEVAWLPEPGSGGDGTASRYLILPSAGRTPVANAATGPAGASGSGGSEDESSADPAPKGDLAALAQNPIANSISVPFEQTLFFHSGEDDETTYVLNIQPVIPARLSDDWNLISRPIIPVMYVPGAVTGISSIDDYDASENDTTDYYSFDNEKWYKIRLRVDGKLIRAWIDDQLIAKVDHTENRISIRIEMELSKPVGLATFQTTGAVKNFKMTELKAAKKKVKINQKLKAVK